jgi:hypothetical protein
LAPFKKLEVDESADFPRFLANLTEFYLIMEIWTGPNPLVFAEFWQNPLNFVTLACSSACSTCILDGRRITKMVTWGPTSIDMAAADGGLKESCNQTRDHP